MRRKSEERREGEEMRERQKDLEQLGERKKGRGCKRREKKYCVTVEMNGHLLFPPQTAPLVLQPHFPN